MKVIVLVVDDEPDVEALFRQQFRREKFVTRPVDFPRLKQDMSAVIGDARGIG